ncbi:hypothetical protein Bbelb_050050 [Branchiostoma belcheri]|nr:hypothetical protein Bbelb_050050 [Branchiostoma belcheri]
MDQDSVFRMFDVGDIERHGVSKGYLDTTADCKKLRRRPQQGHEEPPWAKHSLPRGKEADGDFSETVGLIVFSGVSGWDDDMFILMKTSGITRPMFQRASFYTTFASKPYIFHIEGVFATERRFRAPLRGKNSLGSKSSLAAAYYSRRSQKK